MVRLPTVGGDSGNWGTVLNEFLGEEHGSDGTHSKPLTKHLVMKAKVVTSGASYEISDSTDQIVIINKTSGSATAVTLPSSPTTGMIYTIKDGKGDAATYNITITGNGGVTIDGEAQLVINGNYAAVNLVFNGSEWNIV